MQADYDSPEYKPDYKTVALELPNTPVAVSIDVFSEGDLVSETISKSRIWEPYETHIILQCLGNSGSNFGKTFLDVGANLGYYSLVAKKCCAAKVFAFEPEQRNYNLLEKNLSGCKDVSVFNLALSDQEGATNLYLSPDNMGDHQLAMSDKRKSQIVKQAIGDSLLEGNIDFIKIDTQGAEYKVLKGLTHTLAENRKHLDLIVEFWPLGLERQECNPDDLIELLMELDLFTYIIDHQQHKLIPARRDDLREFAANQKEENLEGFINLFVTSTTAP